MRMCMLLRNAAGMPSMIDQTNRVTTNSSAQVSGSLNT